MSEKALVWFRQDLRVQDHPGLARAIEEGCEVIPVFIWSREEEGNWAPGGASCWWLHHALLRLEKALRAKGLRLIVRKGAAMEELIALLNDTGAKWVYWSRRYEPAVIRRDSALKEQLKALGVGVESSNASLLFEPWTVASGKGTAYKVYTPFSKELKKRSYPVPVCVDWEAAKKPRSWPRSLGIGDLGLLPRIAWDKGFGDFWKPEASEPLQQLRFFLNGTVNAYEHARDIPAEDGTSRISPYLHWGEIGPRQIIAGLQAVPGSAGAEVFEREILWREFAYHVLYHFPKTPEYPLQAAFNRFPWQQDETLLRAWQKGQTGYPVVDAGMRQLWQTGWMHNRVRMIVASLLVKHLLHSWQDGAKWFWDTLVDADLACNTLGWQWAGGCGADAAPYFRVFNPITQGEKFDTDGRYVRRYVPELSRLPDRYLHQPWTAPANVLSDCQVKLGRDYPLPIVEHRAGRERALQAFGALKMTGA